MPCNMPIRAWITAPSEPLSFKGGPPECMVWLKCGKCTGCLMEHARQWSLRCMHEARYHELNCFVTLTYSDDNLPANGSLNYRDFQLFFKRLRKRHGSGIRFFMCGEYGSNFSRPHYHACIFGFDFLDKYPASKSPSGDILYRSFELDDLWKLGFCTLGDLTAQSAGYVARYTLKKAANSASDYGDRVPEFIQMSRRPGIGQQFYKDFRDDIYNHDFLVDSSGHRVRPPNYYDRQLSKDDPTYYAFLKSSRGISMSDTEYDPDSQDGVNRLAAREFILRQKVADRLKRNFEDS